MIVEETYEPEPWEESAIVPEDVFNRLGFWKPSGRSKVILTANFAQLEQGIVGAIVAKYMEGLAERLVRAVESIQYSVVTTDSYASTIKGEFYDPFYKKFRGQRHQECFTLDPVYVNLFTKPYIADMRLHIFRPKLRSNHPKN